MVQQSLVYHPHLDVHPAQMLPCLPVPHIDSGSLHYIYNTQAETLWLSSESGHKKICQTVSTSSLREFKHETKSNPWERRTESTATYQKAENPSIYNIYEITWVSSEGADTD